MSPDEFRNAGREVLEWLAAYQENVEGFPVFSKVAPGDVFRSLPAHPPQRGEDITTLLPELDSKVLPGITHWQSPNWYCYFPCNNSFPSILGDLVSSGLGVQGMLWATSPACTEVEMKILDWLVEMLGLPEHFLSSSAGGGVLQDSASSASLCALLAAVAAAVAPKIEPVFVPRIRLIRRVNDDEIRMHGADDARDVAAGDEAGRRRPRRFAVAQRLKVLGLASESRRGRRRRRRSGRGGSQIRVTRGIRRRRCFHVLRLFRHRSVPQGELTAGQWKGKTPPFHWRGRNSIPTPLPMNCKV